MLDYIAAPIQFQQVEPYALAEPEIFICSN